MDVLVAVIDDLWQFAYSSLFGSIKATKEHKEKEIQNTIPFAVGNKNEQTSLFKSAEVLPKNVSDNDLRSGGQYFIAELKTFLYSDPVIAFDTAIKELPYGQSVMLKKVGGRWAEVEVEGENGWILKDNLTLKSEDVRPQLFDGELYDSHHPETIKLRAAIDDEFGGARADLPLLAAEYVTYKLSQYHMRINWQKDSPRVPGSWQNKLRGVRGVYMNVLPKTHSVMEYVEGDRGHLAFVEAVFPDRSIKISEVGVPEDGYYKETTLAQEEYIELRPVFITVS